MRRVAVRLISVLLTVSMAVALCSCSFNGSISHIVAGNTISAAEIARLIVATVLDPNDLADSYSSIPEEQQGNVSFSYFKEYTDILRRLSRQNGTVNSFRILNDSECMELLSSYVEQSPLDSFDFYARYGDLTAVEFLYENDSKFPVYILLTVNEDGDSCLSSSWIADVINIYNYAEHYFTMLAEQNVDGVFTLIRPGYDVIEYCDDAIIAKAEALTEFYLMNVRNFQSQYDFVSISPIGFKIAIPNVTDQFSDSIVTHDLEIATDSYMNCYVIDSISEVFDDSINSIYEGDNAILHCGDTYTSGQLFSIMGNPINISSFERDDRSMILVNYSGIALSFVIDNMHDDSWVGRLVEVRLHGSNYTAASNIRVGMSERDLMLSYPFIDAMDYNLEYRDEQTYIRIDIVSDNEGIVTRVVVSSLN